jgi:para-nitrobenzyl esterase
MKVSHAMQAAWLSFAKTGSPVCPEVADWPAYEPEQRNTLFIDKVCSVVSNPDKEKHQAWAHARQDDDSPPAQED